MRKNTKRILSLIVVLMLAFSCFTNVALAIDADQDGFDDETGEEIIIYQTQQPGVTAPSWETTVKTETEIQYNNSESFTLNIFSDISDDLMLKANLLNSLKILTGGNDKFEPEKELNAGEFINAAVKILNTDDEYIKQSLREKLSALTGKSYDGNNKLTLREAGSLVVSLLNYNNLRPQGYDLSLIAFETKLFSNMNEMDYQVFTKETCLKLIYNALNATLLSMSVKNGEPYYTKTTDTPLTKYYKIFKRTGVVTGKHETTLKERKSTLQKDEVSIDDNIYKIGKTVVRSLLGQKIDFFYSFDEDKDIRATLVIINPIDNSVATIPSELYISTTNNVVTYFDSLESKKQKNLNFNGNVIFNGKRVDIASVEGARLSDRLTNMDSVTFIDNNNDDTYDVALISKTKTLVVKENKKDSEVLLLDIPYDSTNTLVFNGLSSEGNNNIVHILKDDKEITFNSIGAGAIITIMDSSDTGNENDLRNDSVSVIFAIVTKNKISGEITEISTFDNNENEYTINNKIFVLSKSYKEYINGNLNREFALSEKGDFYLDNTGKIAYAVTDRKKSQTFSIPENVVEGLENGVQYGYLFNIGISKDLNKKCEIELLTMANKFQVFDVADKLDITYYPLYAPYAIYSSPTTIPYDTPIGAYQLLPTTDTNRYYGYIDPVVMRKYQNDVPSTFMDAFNTIYPQLPFESLAALNQSVYFQNGYPKKEKRNAADILKTYFNANVNANGSQKDEFEFDLEKMQLVRYKLDEDGKINLLETAKDYGMPAQWNAQVLKQDTKDNVFRLSVKKYQFRNPNSSPYPLYTGVFRYNSTSRAFFNNVNLSTTAPITLIGTDCQVPLFFLKENSYMFDVPTVSDIVNYYFDNANIFSLDKLNKMRQEKFRYRVLKFNPNNNGNYLVSAYNLDENNSTNILVRNLTMQNVSVSNIRVLVDKISTSLDENGVAVAKLTGYDVNSGKLNTYIGYSDNTFNRKGLSLETAPNVFSGSYKRGDIILIGKDWRNESFVMSEPRFLYDGPTKFRMNNYIAGDTLDANSLDTRNPNGNFPNIPTVATQEPTVVNSVVRYKGDFDAHKGYYMPLSADVRFMYSGEFAGRINDITIPFIKMAFDEPISTSQPTNRVDTNFLRFISPNVKVYEVTDNIVKPIQLNELEPGDFVVGLIVKNAVTQIIKYENIK